MNPAERGRFMDERPRLLDRLYYRADDGWRAPLLYIPPAPGGAGEPVILAHALGGSPDLFRSERSASLAGTLSAAGFSVYLLAHRGDASALPPAGRSGFCFDDIVEQDVPAALERACAHSGYARAHWVGHGLGGQLGLGWAARGGDRFAAVVAMCAPVAFSSSMTVLRRSALLAALLPAHWSLPTGRVAPALAPWVADREPIAGERLRGALAHSVGDVPVELLRQLGRWVADGSMVDACGLFDYREALRSATGDLLVVVAPDDGIAGPWATAAAADAWGGRSDLLRLPEGYGRLDALIGREASAAVFEPVASWLTARRRQAWEDAG